jgi:FkbM family methyltransferase
MTPVNMSKEFTQTQLNLPGVSDAHRLLRDMAGLEGGCTSRKVDKPLILYGAGDLGKMAKEYFKRLGIPFLYVVDASPQRYIDSVVWKGIDIIKPADVPPKHRKECLLVICIVNVPYSEICKPLKKQGWLDIVPFYDITEAYTDKIPLTNGWFAEEFSEEDIHEIEYVLSCWKDDISRAHHLQFIAWHKLRKEIMFDNAPVDTGNRYFIPQITLSIDEQPVFIDGGAHHGEVSLKFMDIVGHKFKKIYAIEPDRLNADILRDKLSIDNQTALQKIQIITCLLGSAHGKVSFFGGLDYASKICITGQDSVKVQTLDELDIPATFIKLHLEGHEHSALLGSLNTINKYRPLIAATIYHNRDGLWKTPALLMKKLTDYVFLLRLHSWMGTGCVLYAIPRERYLNEY